MNPAKKPNGVQEVYHTDMNSVQTFSERERHGIPENRVGVRSVSESTWDDLGPFEIVLFTFGSQAIKEPSCCQSVSPWRTSHATWRNCLSNSHTHHRIYLVTMGSPSVTQSFHHDQCKIFNTRQLRLQAVWQLIWYGIRMINILDIVAAEAEDML